MTKRRLCFDIHPGNAYKVSRDKSLYSDDQAHFSVLMAFWSPPASQSPTSIHGRPGALTDKSPSSAKSYGVNRPVKVARPRDSYF